MKNDIEKRFKAISEIEPVKEELEAIKRIEQENDTSAGVTLEEMDKIRMEREYSGKISLRVPKTLHRELVKNARHENISLNQYILYKLAR